MLAKASDEQPIGIRSASDGTRWKPGGNPLISKYYRGVREKEKTSDLMDAGFLLSIRSLSQKAVAPFNYCSSSTAAWAAARRAIGTRKGEQEA